MKILCAEMKIDESYEDFFYSLGVALIICTLFVSIGKLITDYYFLYVVICSLLIIVSLTIYDYRRHKVELQSLKKVRKQHRLSARKLVTSTKNAVKSIVVASFNVHSTNSVKKSGLRRRARTDILH